MALWNFETEKSLGTSNKETLRQGRGSGNSFVLKNNYLPFFFFLYAMHMPYGHMVYSLYEFINITYLVLFNE